MKEETTNNILKNLYLITSAYSLKSTSYIGKNNDAVFEIKIRRNDFKETEEVYTKHEAKINLFLVKEIFKTLDSIFKFHAELFKEQGGER